VASGLCDHGDAAMNAADAEDVDVHGLGKRAKGENGAPEKSRI
jgi:hypothetical protein